MLHLRVRLAVGGVENLHIGSSVYWIVSVDPSGRRRRSTGVLNRLLTLVDALHGSDPVWLVEGEKKALAVAQLGLPAGINAGHDRGDDALLSGEHEDDEEPSRQKRDGEAHGQAGVRTRPVPAALNLPLSTTTAPFTITCVMPAG